jgi:uncharacterized protein YjgD (DUF1641 family)
MANNKATSTAQMGIAGLSADELKGLAQLGGMVGKLGEALSNGAAGAAAGAVHWAGDVYERYDLPELLEEALAALKAMRDSGLLALIRDNAGLVMETLDLLKPLAGKAVAAAGDAPLERWKQHAATLDRLLLQARALGEFVDRHMAGELTRLVVELTALSEETDAEATAAEALRALARMRRNGTLQRLADLSDHLAAFADNVDTGALVGDLVDKASHSPLVDQLARATTTASRVARAVETVGPLPARGGGLGGMIKLLKDPEVQHGLRVAAAVVGALQNDRATATGEA